MNPSHDDHESPSNDASEHEAPATANPGYALGRLAAALNASHDHPDPEARRRAQKKAENWVQVLDGIISGTLRIGSRTPVARTPAWATLEVVQGGFATGSLLAEGPLQPHEEALLARIDFSSDSRESPRSRLNRYYLSDAGLAELRDLLRSGGYRINVPEEGALPVFAWLTENDETDAARDLLDILVPYFDRLRFYPVPDTRPQPDDSVRVCLQTVGETVEDLKAMTVPLAYRRQRESTLIWAPLLDRVVQLFLETVEGEWPCQTYPDGWAERARTLLNDYRRLRGEHRLCRKPDRKDSSFGFLRACLETCARDPRRLTGREVGRIRVLLAGIIARRGTPSSEECRALRRAQVIKANLPTNAELARVVIGRLSTRPQDEGLDGTAALQEALSPVTAEEAAGAANVSGGEALASRLGEKVRRCLIAPPEVLVEQKVITSSEVLARVLPQITAQVNAAGFADSGLRRLYGAIYRAFRRRRSLLLLNLESQVKLTELPWIRAISAHRQQADDTKAQARQTLATAATLAVTAFPQQIIPNKLLQEFRALVQSAELEVDGSPLPLVDEVAADIFMGAFSPKFLQAAKIAGHLLEGTLYERYYGLSYARIREIPAPPPASSVRAKKASSWLSWKSAPPPSGGEPASPVFFEMCRELAERAERAGGTDSRAPRAGFSVARNGMIIEQEQILTTHNLAALFVLTEIGETLAPRRGDLARACFAWICRRQRQMPADWQARLQLVKNSAYAWRQMVFFLALEPAESVRSFLVWAADHLNEQPEALRERLRPALSGLESALQGGSPGIPFLGWTTGKHWLMP